MYRLILLRNPNYKQYELSKLYHCVSKNQYTLDGDSDCSSNNIHNITAMIVRTVGTVGDISYFDNLVSVSNNHDYLTVLTEGINIDYTAEYNMDIEDPNNFHRWVYAQTDLFETVEDLIASPQLQILEMSIHIYQWLLTVIGSDNLNLSENIAYRFLRACTFAELVNGDVTYIGKRGLDTTPLIRSIKDNIGLCQSYARLLYSDGHRKSIRFIEGEDAIAKNGYYAYTYCIQHSLQIEKMHDKILDEYGERSNEYQRYKNLPLEQERV